MAYSQTDNVTNNVTDVLATQYNSLRAEIKAAVEGLQLGDDVDITITNTGGAGSDLLSQIAFVDAQADASLDIDCTTTINWTNDEITTVVSVFSALSITLTETLTISGGKLTAIARALT